MHYARARPQAWPLRYKKVWRKNVASPKFTKKELCRYNGLAGAPAYIAYKGKVYDVSDSFLWQRGQHQATHQAGQDLTDSLDEAPHGPELLARVRLIGILVDDG